MNASNGIGRFFLVALLIGLATGNAVAQGKPVKDPTEPFAGAKLIYKFPSEVYRTPILANSKAGPRLLLWIDARDPIAQPRPKTLLDAEKNFKEPEVDFVIWDVPENKESHRSSTKKKEKIPDAHLMTRDGKKIVYAEVNFNEFSDAGIPAYIKVYDPATRKSQTIPGKYRNMDVLKRVLVAPDGALVIIQEANTFPKTLRCTVQEIGKNTPRKSFQVIHPKSATDTLTIFAQIDDAVISPDGSFLAVAIHGDIRVYDLKSGKVILQADQVIKKSEGARQILVKLALASSKDEAKLLTFEVVSGKPNEFKGLARVFDLKTKKEIVHSTLIKGGAAAGKIINFSRFLQATLYFNSKAEARVLFRNKLYDVAANKALLVCDPRDGLFVSDDLKYAVRLVANSTEINKRSVEIWSVNLDR